MKNKKTKNNVFATFVKLLKYLKRYQFHFWTSILFTAVSVILSLYIPILIGRAIDEAIGEGNVNIDIIKQILFKIIICIVISAILQWFINILNNKMTYGIAKNIRTEAFSKIQKFPVSYIDSHPTGEVVSRVITDVEQLSDGLLLGFTQFFNGIMTIIVTLVFMLMISPIITAVVVVVTPFSMFVASFIAKKTFAMFKLQSETRSEQTGLVDESIGGKKVIRAFSQENQVIERFDEINERLGKASLNAIFFSSITNPSTRFVNSVVYALVTLSGGLLFLYGNFGLTIGIISSFLAYSTQYTKPFNEISGVITELQNSFACAERVFEVIEAPLIEEDAKETEKQNANGDVDFVNVSFSYSSDKPLIENLNLSVKDGQRIAIVGPTGCGKTTLINLLMRFYDVDDGDILIGGRSIKDMSRKELRSSCGMVLQDTWLSPATIRENISFGNKNASDDEIIAAAKAAHAHSFIRRLPNGYDTVIGEDGGSLSGGQKQLLCIARLMLSLPDILILDEATSSIDTRTEIKIQKAFETMMNGRTTFIVAHRLSTIKEADKILVMKDGNIIETGTHSELLKQKGFYHELYNSQFCIL